jgi:lysophospholipase L1-like esterase
VPVVKQDRRRRLKGVGLGEKAMRILGLACALALALAGTSAWAAPGRWIGTWAASPTPPMAAQASNPNLATPSFSNQTVVQVVRLSAGGQSLRVRLTNEYGTKPLAIGAARVALVGPDGAEIAGSGHALAYGGASQATIPAGAPLLSDPVSLATTPLARLRISLYLPGDTGPCTCHPTGAEPVSVAPGDATEGKVAPTRVVSNNPFSESRAFISGVEVETSAARAPVVVAFGDSITDGYRSTSGADRRWPDRLAERLVQRYPGAAAAVDNAAISGNRVLSEALAVFGQSALSRFDRDVLSIPGATHVIVLEGVNDLGMGKPTADQLIIGYRQLIARAHAHGLKIIGGTILPYEGAAYFSAVGEAERQKVNAWIRTGKAFDGVIDFDAATRDPAKPTKMRAELQSGDWLHPNDAGYKVMGEAVDLSLFR